MWIVLVGVLIFTVSSRCEDVKSIDTELEETEPSPYRYDAPNGPKYGERLNQGYLRKIVDYEYSIDDSYGNEQSKREHIEDGTAVGEYRTRLPDGSLQIVSYTASPEGYKANVQTLSGANEYSASGEASHEIDEPPVYHLKEPTKAYVESTTLQETTVTTEETNINVEETTVTTEDTTIYEEVIVTEKATTLEETTTSSTTTETETTTLEEAFISEETEVVIPVTEAIPVMIPMASRANYQPLISHSYQPHHYVPRMHYRYHAPKPPYRRPNYYNRQVMSPLYG